MDPFVKHHPAGNPDDEPETLIALHEHEHNTNEGSEFLDDALRMREQPLQYVEKSIAVGSPENLL
jgi:hypothetical protein